MYLEKGIEEFGENHKPSPFMIICPHCGGWAMDISGIQKVPGGGYVPLPEGYSYFADLESRDCGVPVFCLEAERTKASASVQDVDEIIDRLTSVEMEKRRENLRKELDQMKEILKSAGEAMDLRLKEYEIEVKRIAKIMGIGVERTESQPEKLADLEKKKDRLDSPVALDRKEARKKQRAAERETASRLRQYRVAKNCWAAGKRTGPRRREWRGPWKEG